MSESTSPETAPSAPAPTPLGGGTPTTPERAWLPEAYRADPTFEPIKDIEGLAKSYKHAAGLVGLDKGAVLRIPKDDDAEGWNALHARLGRPDTPDAYQFPELPGELLEGVEPAARAAFHELGLSGKQAAGVMGLYAAQAKAAVEAREARALEIEGQVIADLKKEWGEAFDERTGALAATVRQLGGEDLVKLMNEARMPDGVRLGSHPLLIRAFAEVAQRLAEPSTLRGGSAGQHPGAITPVQAQARIAELQSDPAFRAEFADRNHPKYSGHKAEWERLHRAAYPDS